MNLKIALALALLSIPAFTHDAYPADDIIIPSATSGGLGKAYFKDNGGNLWPAQIIYTTDGSGNAIPVGSSLTPLGNVEQGGVSISAAPWQMALYNVGASVMSATNPVSCRITNGSAYEDPTQIRALSSGTDSVSVPGVATAANQATQNTTLTGISNQQTSGGQKTQLVDGSGNVIGSGTFSAVNYLNVRLSASTATGSAVPSTTVQVGGSDGTNLRTWLMDALGIGQISLGNTAKTAKVLTGSLTTTAVTANQVVFTYTVSAGKTLYIESFDLNVHTTAANTTAVAYGAVTLLINGSVVWSGFLEGTGAASTVSTQFGEPIPVPAGEVVSWEATPAAVTSWVWNGNVGGYEK